MNSPSSSELTVLKGLVAGNVEASTHSMSIDSAVFSSLVGKSWIQPATDHHGGYDGFRITKEGQRVLAVWSG